LPDPAACDEFLMQATGKGDLEAFEEIVQRHHSWAWRITYRFLGDEPEAADIVQEAFLRLLDASRRYRPTAKFRTYFYRIITRLCLDRSKKRHPLYARKVWRNAVRGSKQIGVQTIVQKTGEYPAGWSAPSFPIPTPRFQRNNSTGSPACLLWKRRIWAYIFATLIPPFSRRPRVLIKKIKLFFSILEKNIDQGALQLG